MKSIKTILITGSKGQLGFDIIKKLSSLNYNIITTDYDSLDITNKANVDSVISEHKPDLVLHLAAYTQVDKAESHQREVFNVNINGTKYIADACKRVGSTLIFISTDYVFDGKGNKPYGVDDKKNGLSVYGKSKSLAEDYIIENLNNYFILRTSWLFGINGNNFIKKIIALSDENKETISVVTDQYGSPTYTIDLADFISKIILTDKYGIYNVTNSGYCSRYEIAEYVLNLIGSKSILEKSTTDQNLKNNLDTAVRPLNSRLSTDEIKEIGFSELPNWKDAVVRFIKNELRR